MSAGSAPKIARPSSVRPAPTSPAKPTISPARTRRSAPAKTRALPSPRASKRMGPREAGSGARAVDVGDRAAHHVGDEEVLVDVLHRGVADEPTVAENGHGVRDLEDLREVVGDVEAGDAPRGEPADVLEQPDDLHLGEGGGGLVHDQHGGIRGDGLEDLHHLLVGRRE